MAKNKHEDICSCRIFMVSITAINFFTFILTILAWQVICVVGSKAQGAWPTKWSSVELVSVGSLSRCL